MWDIFVGRIHLLDHGRLLVSLCTVSIALSPRPESISKSFFISILLIRFMWGKTVKTKIHKNERGHELDRRSLKFAELR